MVREAEVLIQFDMTKLTDEEINKLFQAELLLREIGITFDSGVGCDGRDWEWDWSLKGPVKVFFKKFKGEKDVPQNNNEGMSIMQEVGC